MDYRESTRPFQAVTYAVSFNKKQEVMNRTQIRSLIRENFDIPILGVEQTIRDIELGAEFSFNITPKKVVRICRDDI